MASVPEMAICRTDGAAGYTVRNSRCRTDNLTELTACAGLPLPVSVSAALSGGRSPAEMKLSTIQGVEIQYFC